MASSRFLGFFSSSFAPSRPFLPGMFRLFTMLTFYFFLKLAAFAQSAPIQHVIFIVQENRSFCNYFGTFPGENCTQGQTSTGAWVPLTHAPDQAVNCQHTWYYLHLAMDAGKMDKFDKICGTTPNNLQAYVQYYQSDIPNYWHYAQTYGLADNFFPSLAGPSLPNHLYIVAGQSANMIGSPGNPGAGILGPLGYCDPATTQTVQALDPTTFKMFQMSPCIDITTIADLLDSAGVTWAYYADTTISTGISLFWNPYNAIRHIRTGADYQKVKPYSQFITDATAGTLPQVVWLTPPVKYSEHPPASVTVGMNWVTKQINAVMNGPLWGSSVIFLTWDDEGGFYDSVPPPKVDVFGLGPRVPFLCIGAYCKPGYLSHAQMEFSSVNKCIENLFGLPSLSPRDINVVDACQEMMDYSLPRRPAYMLPAKQIPMSLKVVPANPDSMPDRDEDD